MYILLGGFINAVAIKNFVEWYYWVVLQFELTKIVLEFIVYGILVLLTPLLLSWFFSRTHPDKRIVPPLFIQGFAFVFLFFFVYNALVADFQTYYLIAIYALSAGLVQDRIMVELLGKNVISDDIIRHSFSVHSRITRVQEIVMSKQFRTLLGLKKVVRKTGESLKLRTSKKADWQNVLEVKEAKKRGKTIINLAIYEERAYSIKHVEKADDVYEYAMGRISYIKDYFLRRHSIKVDDASLDNAESLVTYVLDDLQGRITRFQEMTTRKRISVVLSVIFIFASIGLFAFDRINEGIATLAIAVGLIIDVLR